jgi:LemA protein
MSVAVIVIVAILALVVLYGVFTFNRLVRMGNECDQLFSDIDVQLKRRHDLVPNLVETVRGYASHERQTFENVTAARSAAVAASGPAAQTEAENALGAALRQLFAVAENYPELRASRNFLALQNELSEIEDRIQEARRSYNVSVRDMNVSIASLPSRIVARMAGMRPRDFFELEEPADREVPSVSFAGGSV